MGFGSGAAKGSTTGAAIGSYWGPVGTGIGAAAGGLLGGIRGWLTDDSGEQDQTKMAEIRKRLEELARKQRAQREEDLSRALAYFAPAQQELTRLYGIQMPNKPPGGGG